MFRTSCCFQNGNVHFCSACCLICMVHTMAPDMLLLLLYPGLWSCCMHWGRWTTTGSSHQTQVKLVDEGSVCVLEQWHSDDVYLRCRDKLCECTCCLVS